MKAKWIFLGAAAAVALSISSAGAAELRVGIHADALTLDPANHRDRETETIIRNMHDGLVTRDSAMKVVPELAESWTALDPLTYEFKLRQGVTFHDGSPMTAEDIKFTFDRLVQEGAMEGQTSPRKGLLGPLSEINIVDERTVRFILSEPWPILPAMLPFQEVVSKAHVEKVGTNGMADQVNGTGPFRLIDWRKGDSVIMERFDDYYGGARRYSAGGQGLCRARHLQGDPGECLPGGRASGRRRAHHQRTADALGQAGREQPGHPSDVGAGHAFSFFIALNNQKAPFNDVRVRQAVAHALDRQLIVDRILDGNATLIDGILSPDAFGKNTNLPAYARSGEGQGTSGRGRLSQRH
jgi:peptide/nickel transport system substrate-binding protein